MSNLKRTSFIILLSVFGLVCCSATPIDSLAAIKSSLNSPLYQTYNSPSYCQSDYSSVVANSQSAALSPSKYIIKRTPVDFDQDLIAKFQHPNGRIQLNDRKKIDSIASLKSDEERLDDLAVQTKMENHSNEDTNDQILNQSPKYRQLYQGRTPNRRTRIRFLVGSSEQPAFEAQSNPDQSTNLANNQKRNDIDYQPESSEPASAFLYKRTTGDDTYSSNQLTQRHQSNDGDIYSPKQLNQHHQFNSRFSYPMAIDGRQRSSFMNDQANDQPTGLQGESTNQSLKNRRTKKALSLFAHWKPRSAETSYLTGHSAEFFPKSYNKISSRSHYRPLGQPLRWG